MNFHRGKSRKAQTNRAQTEGGNVRGQQYSRRSRPADYGDEVRILELGCSVYEMFAAFAIRGANTHDTIVSMEHGTPLNEGTNDRQPRQSVTTGYKQALRKERLTV